MIRAVAVVIPAHDEERLIGRCLESVRAARARLPSSVASCTVVVLDDCEDATARIARDELEPNGDEAADVSYRNVGSARACGVVRALARFRAIPERDVWLATTDADSRVPRDWLVDQLALANSGVDAVAGVVEVDDWESYPRERARAYETFYRGAGDDVHDHVHGANLGVRASVYSRVGGFSPMTTGEDHALWNAVRAAGHTLISTRRISVATSARLVARAPFGFAHFLSAFHP